LNSKIKKIGLIAFSVLLVMAIVAGGSFFVYEEITYGVDARNFPTSKIQSLLGKEYQDVEEFCKNSQFKKFSDPSIPIDELILDGENGSHLVKLYFDDPNPFSKQKKVVGYYVLYSNPNSVRFNGQIIAEHPVKK